MVAMIARARPTARRAPSISNTTPMIETTISAVVGNGDASPAGPSECGKARKGEQQGKGQVNDARLAVIDHAEIEVVRQRRCVPKLEERPGKRNQEDECFAETGRLAPAGVGLRNHGLER